MQRLGHTSSRLLRPVYSSTRRISARFHDGTPAKAVMFSPVHSRQMASALRSKSAMRAVCIFGARNQPLQKVVSWMSSAERSPTRFDPSCRHEPPSVSVLPSKTFERGVVGREDRRHVAHAHRMVPPQRFPRDGDVLAPVGGGARRAGKERDAARSRHVGLTGQHPLDVGLEGVVVERLDHRGELLGRADAAQVVAPAELRAAAPAQKLPEHARLGLHGMAAEGVDGPLALREVGPQKYAAK